MAPKDFVTAAIPLFHSWRFTGVADILPMDRRFVASQRRKGTSSG
jgi:hypothetical protein